MLRVKRTVQTAFSQVAVQGVGGCWGTEGNSTERIREQNTFTGKRISVLLFPCPLSFVLPIFLNLLQVNYMADDAMAMVQAKEGGGEEKDEATADAETLAREAAKAEEKAKRAQAARVMAGGAGGVKRKGGSEGEELEAVERQAKRLQAVTAAAVAALERNEEEIDIDDMEEEGEEGDRIQEGGEEKEIHIEGDTKMQVKAKPVPAAVFARAGLEENAKDGEVGHGGSMGALERLKKAGGQR